LLRAAQFVLRVAHNCCSVFAFLFEKKRCRGKKRKWERREEGRKEERGAEGREMESAPQARALT
jgi:hypothetical protein